MFDDVNDSLAALEDLISPADDVHVLIMRERYTALVDKGHSTTSFPGSLCLSFSPAPERPWERDLSKRDTSLEKPRACNTADASILIAVMCRNHRYLMGRERVENVSPDLSTS